MNIWQTCVFAFVANIASVASVVIVGALASSGKDGWGWFLFMAYAMHTSEVKLETKREKEATK